MKRATVAADGFDDGIYFHTHTMKKDDPPKYKLKDVPGFDLHTYGGWVSLEKALLFIKAICGSKPVVVHCMHCLE